uniref:Uncharacterized protein n=1 Tax=Rhizophora mucronata TaxID=61149 RepID=A0A2P2QQQ7_RHIMU
MSHQIGSANKMKSMPYAGMEHNKNKPQQNPRLNCSYHRHQKTKASEAKTRIERMRRPSIE